MPKSLLYIGCTKFGALFETIDVYTGSFMLRHYSNSDGLLSVSMVDVGGEGNSLYRTENGHDYGCKQIAANYFKTWAGCTLDEARAAARDCSHELETA